MNELIYECEGRPTQTVRECNCGKCGETFFVPKPDEGKWHPSYCPFCGMKFEYNFINDDPATYSPKSE